MKYFLIFTICVLAFNGIIKAQSTPILYFCERYDDYNREIGISDRFSKGYLTVVVKCDNALNLNSVKIQFDKYDANTLSFQYYKQFVFTIEPSSSYVYFSKNESSDMSFDEPGFYRVFLLDGEDDAEVTSSLIQIIP